VAAVPVSFAAEAATRRSALRLVLSDKRSRAIVASPMRSQVDAGAAAEAMACLGLSFSLAANFEACETLSRGPGVA